MVKEEAASMEVEAERTTKPSIAGASSPFVDKTLVGCLKSGCLCIFRSSFNSNNLLSTRFHAVHQAPGDTVLDLTRLDNQTLRLGGGLRQDCDNVTVTKVGRLRYTKPNKYWVEGSQKRYTPAVEDKIIGIVVDSKSDNFLVDIKGPTLAFLPVLAFEGGTRKNIPKFENGALIYTRVVKTNRDMNPELSCTDASGKASEFGSLTGGYMFECSSGLARA